jgi:hypothetical protein
MLLVSASNPGGRFQAVYSTEFLEISAKLAGSLPTTLLPPSAHSRAEREM